nr:DUF6064 family protein [Pseudoduganella buxea]
MFSARTYWRLLELYNVAVWPLQLAAVALGLAIAWCARRAPRDAGRAAAVLLGLTWLWVAWAYHAQRYATINMAAPWFAAAFALQAMLLVGAGTLHLRPGRATGGAVGFVLLAYPLLAPVLGRPWTQAEVFGIAPDATAALTLVLLAGAPRAHALLWPVPLLWCAVSGATLWTMHAPLAWLLPGLGLAALLVRLRS